LKGKFPFVDSVRSVTASYVALYASAGLSFFFQHLLKDKGVLRLKDFPATSRRDDLRQNGGFEKRLIPQQNLVH